ncbi:hypothetical protein Cgig2_010097 [Carnegiea gigantea]|uniref:RNase H type-1 domain-containing protein n=1 Tax=Carnegiea gigantea TaxID=171969 RepID=A0A9Q1K5Z6_9CARY|nr:hypothetical protein Cgig2_010097 [Carnegiea gigantea]
MILQCVSTSPSRRRRVVIDWLRATPVKKKAKENEKEILQERQRLLNLRESGKGNKGKVRLNFDKSSVTDMNIDTEIINVGGEMAKRKKDNTDSGSPKDAMRKNTKWRRFENFWALDDRCEGVVSNAWMSINSDGPAMRCSEKIKRCMGDLSTWNQEAFGNIQLEIKKHLNLLKQTSDARARKLIFNTISDLRRKEEVYNNDVPECSSPLSASFWKSLWLMDMPSRMKMACSNALPANAALANRVHSVDVRWGLSGHLQESAVHALLECDHAAQVWNCSPFAKFIRDRTFRSIQDAIDAASQADSARIGEFIVVMWSCWNQRNECLFTNVNFCPRHAITKALDFVREFREVDQHFQAPRSSFPSCWNALIRGLAKINFDGAKLGDGGRSWGAMGRDSNGVILFAAVKQNSGFSDPETEEATLGYKKIIIEGDCSSIISKLKKRSIPNTSTRFAFADILNLVNRFDFCSFSYVKRVGNRIAHTLAHFQPYSCLLREWLGEGPDHVLDLALKDLCAASNST